MLAAAIQAGYYAHPRRITMTRLAQAIGVCKSTLSETLMIIEHKVLQAHQNAGTAALRPA